MNFQLDAQGFSLGIPWQFLTGAFPFLPSALEVSPITNGA